MVVSNLIRSAWNAIHLQDIYNDLLKIVNMWIKDSACGIKSVFSVISDVMFVLWSWKFEQSTDF